MNLNKNIGENNDKRNSAELSPQTLTIVQTTLDKRGYAVQTRKRRHNNNPLRNLRIQHGLTLDDLAEKSGLSPSYLSRLEGGSRRLNQEILELLCKTLGCKSNDLVEMTEIPEKYTIQTQQNAVLNRKKIPFYKLKKKTNGYSIEKRIIGQTQAPVNLSKTSQCFALKFDDTEHHHMIYVDPKALIEKNQPAFIENINGTCIIGKLVDLTSQDGKQTFTLSQSLSDKEGEYVKVERSEIKSLFRVIV